MEPLFQDPNHHSENDLRDRTAHARLRLVEPSEKQAAVLSSIGQDLRKARQAKGLEISQISSSLKISKRHLNAIEKSDVEALPLGDVYLIGYTRAYARYLGLNSTQCVERLKNEIAERKSSGKANTAPSQNSRLPSVVRHTLRFLGFGYYEL